MSQWSIGSREIKVSDLRTLLQDFGDDQVVRILDMDNGGRPDEKPSVKPIHSVEKRIVRSRECIVICFDSTIGLDTA